MDDKKLLNLFTDMTRIHTAYVERRLLHLGVHTGQGAIVTTLGESGPCSQKELAEARHVSAATISVMLGRMEKAGLITRALSEDGKCNEIALTGDGYGMYRALCQDMEGEPERVFEGLTEEDKAQAEHLFTVLSRNLARNLEKTTNG